MEFFGRRVRGAEDLVFDAEVPVVCIVPGPDAVASRRGRAGSGGVSRAGRRGVVGA
jgi:hypothetical protein